MKLPLPFSIFDFRFSIHKKNRQARRGIALVITLIMLAVTLVMAVAFMALARRERGSVSTSTDTTTARLAADTAVANAQAQIVANILSSFGGLGSTNAYNLHLLVSTNYINPFGLVPNLGNPTNVNYQYDSSGKALSVTEFEQNVSNLYLLPRVPVFVPISQSPLTYDFRYYLDLNENGRFETNYFGPDFDFAGNVLPGTPYLHTGDPEWVGVLEHPDAPHGPNNHFVSRYAFIAVPVGNTLDLNYIHNQALNPTLSVNDGFMRNQGVGSWEINLAAFLADLNTNFWAGPAPLPNNTFYAYNEPTNYNSGHAFDDARAILMYRYNFNPLLTANNVFARANNVFPFNGVDNYSRGPLQTTLDYNRYFLPPPPSVNDTVPWPGANNTNHFFTLGDLLDTTKLGGGANSFIGRLASAGNNNDTYDRYTYYRMLDQLGTDSSPDDGKLNLNYSNAVVNNTLVNGTVVPTSIGVEIGAETNLVPWRPQDFFNAAADQLLHLYTAEWFQNDPTNFLTTYYGYIPRGYVDATGLGVTNFPYFGQTNQVPAFGITNIPVLMNGSFVYSPAVNRLLQLAANLYDASTNNYKNLPHVFRPIFEHDAVSNVFVVGYTNLISSAGPNTVSGPNDLQLAAPHPVLDLLSLSPNFTPVRDNTGGLVNVYGVPWIIGAKKGLPNFNQFYLLNAAQVTRKLEVARSSQDPATAVYKTNQMYIIGISNNLGVTFWNSYNAAYPRPLRVFASDSVTMVMTNPAGPLLSTPTPVTFTTNTTVPAWPGSQWTGTPPNATPQANAFLPFNWSFVFLPPEAYNYANVNFDPTGQWQPTTPPLPQLPQFGLLITNYLQAYILDGNNVIDYVQLRDPISVGGLNQALADPNYVQPNNIYYQWSTNAYQNQIPPNTPYGVINQIWVSGHPGSAPVVGGKWNNAPTPSGLTTPQAEADFFNGFFTPSFQSYGKPYINRDLVVQAPYTPSRTVYSSFLLQANDPLVHYLSSDLNSQTGSLAIWAAKQALRNGVWYHSDDPLNQPLPTPPTTPIGGRYQPWGQSKQLSSLSAVDTNAYNLAYKDPLAWGSDYWDFPTNAYPAVGWIGRVHRGTPWQTVDLKSTNILSFAQNLGKVVQNVGSNTWANWTGDIQLDYFGQYYDAANAAPMQDRLLFDIFTTRYNDNAARGTLPVNQTHLAAWSALLSGLVVLSNAQPVITGSAAIPSYDYLTIGPAGVDSANSVLSNIVANINATRANAGVFPYQGFVHAGDVLQTPALSDDSPFLNRNAIGLKYGIGDEAYEWLPQQIMGLVRGTEPRYVLYCYGQALRPAPGGIVLSGPFFQLVTNYQVMAETTVRAVIRVDNVNTSKPRAVVESYNVLPSY